MLSISLFKISLLSDAIVRIRLLWTKDQLLRQDNHQSPVYSTCPTAAFELYKDTATRLNYTTTTTTTTTVIIISYGSNVMI
jgi:hypothetical protein